MDDFWNRVRILEPSDCWEWTKGKSPKGYGRYTKAKRRGMPSGSHRVAWVLTYGTIPDGLYVLHKCDNPSCCNPFHLFLGTAKDNASDMVNKKRQLKGESNPAHKLTEKEVRSILEDDGLIKDIAKRYNVSVVLIYYIKKHKSWRYLHA